jgi:rRNA maturation endonuclease Nob1
MSNSWINDIYIHCLSCDCISKSYFLKECGETNFCPNCGSRDTEDYYEDENEVEQ